MKKVIIMLSFVWHGCATPPPKISIEIKDLPEIAKHTKLAPGTPVMCKHSTVPYTIHDDSATDSTRFVTMSRPHTTLWGLSLTSMPVTLKTPPDDNGDIIIVRGTITTTHFGKLVQVSATCALVYALYQLRAFVQ